MKVLLDECIPRRFRNSLSNHDCRTVPGEGLAGKKNGELLALAQSLGFNAFVTLDRGIEYQQNLQARVIAIILIRAKSNRLADLLPHVPDVLKTLASLQPGQLLKLG